MQHLKSWFEQSVECPSGCGCRCGELTLRSSSTRDPFWRDQDEDEDEDAGEEELDSQEFDNEEDFVIVFE